MTQKEQSRKEREREQHKEDILNAALDLFSEKGFVNVSMNQIAERAEFATGTLYNFFKSKDDMFREVVKDNLDRGHEKLMEALETGDDEYSRLKSFIKAKGEIAQKNIKFVQLYMRELHGPGFELVKEDMMRMILEGQKKLSGVFAEGMKKGIFRNMDPDMMALSLDGLSSVFLCQALHFPETFNYSEKIDTIMEILFEKNLIE